MSGKLELRRLSISIHALREEGDQAKKVIATKIDQFLSTPSARRATRYSVQGVKLVTIFLSTPSARRATGAGFPAPAGVEFLSTPSARRATHCSDTSLTKDSIFLSTPSARRATNHSFLIVISVNNFYPRPPRGGRQQKQRENPLLLSHYTPLCTNCKEVPVKQTAKSHRYLCKRLVFRCEASGKTMCAACSHWRGIKRSAHYPAQTPGAAQHARP